MKRIIIVLSLMLLFVACSESGSNDKSKTIVLRGGDHDNKEIHNNIAKTILENGYGYDVEVTSGSSMATFQGLKDGEIDVELELWSHNVLEAFEQGVQEGKVKQLSVNFDDNEQGIYVPTYVIEGDEERGIEPMAPDLKTMEDLKNYPELFEDPEDPGRGRIVGSPTSWVADDVLRQKVVTYGIDETMNYFSPGSDSALVTSLVKAYEHGEPWVGYYWSPTIITAQYDLTILEEPPYDEKIWEENKGTAFPANDVLVIVNADFPEQHPEATEFLSNYETSSALTEAALEYMDENDATHHETAIWWMSEFADVWTTWVPEDIAEKIKSDL